MVSRGVVQMQNNKGFTIPPPPLLIFPAWSPYSPLIHLFHLSLHLSRPWYNLLLPVTQHQSPAHFLLPAMPNKDSSSLNNGCMHAHTEEKEKRPYIYLIIYYTLYNFIKIQSIFTKEQQKKKKIVRSQALGFHEWLSVWDCGLQPGTTWIFRPANIPKQKDVWCKQCVN